LKSPDEGSPISGELSRTAPPLHPRLRERAALWVARPFFALLALLARILPRRTLLAVAATSSRAIFRLFPGVRANLLANAGRVLGPDSSDRERADLGRAMLESFARFLAELLAPERNAPAQDLHRDTRGREHFDAAIAAGKGVIAMTLHMGNYEVASTELASLWPNVAIVYNTDPIALVEWLRSRRRRAKRLGEIVINDSRFFAIEVLQRLREGGIILLAGDQVAARDGERFPFLHGTASFSLWPARLSLASGAPILPAFNVRRPDGTYELRLEKPVFPAADRDPKELMAELLRVFDAYLREHAGQWLMIRKFWLDDAAKGAASGEFEAR
jgi:lauroyl/myristoyl acyltransferase